MAANPHRGEVDITLDGVTYQMRPTYSAIVAWETACGAGTLEIIRRMAARTYRTREIVEVIAAGMAAGGHRPTSDQVGEMVVSTGQAHVIDPVLRLLEYALTGGKDIGASPPGEDVAADQT